MTDSFDLIVLGGGPVGENLADRAVRGGLTALIVESELVGGECSYWACMPSKALLRSNEALQAARAVPGAAEAVTGDLDVAAVLARRDAFASNWSDAGQVEWLESAHIELARGHGRISGPHRVTVTTEFGTVRELEAREAVAIATGSDAAIPAIPGLAEAAPWTSREATSVHEVPDSIVIIGGGVVAAEMATVFAGFGTEVTLLVRGSLLSTMEPFAGELVAAALAEAGVRILENATTTRVDRIDGVVHAESTAGTILADEVLVATGRVPRTADIGLDTVGLIPGDTIDVDDTMRVLGSSWLYAAGDVTGRALLTHQGKYQARAAGDVIAARARGAEIDDAPWGRHVATADHRAVPQVTFTDPQVASVGLTLERAREDGFDCVAADYNLGSVAGASLREDGYTGHARIVVDRARQVILGATFVGPDVAELLQAATIAVVGEVPIARLWHAVPAYPTVSEIWLRLLETLGRDTAEDARG